MRYHIMYSDTLILPNGEKVKVSDVHFEEPKHDYDIGTRLDYGLRQREDEANRFLEDFMKDNFVRIMEIGPSSYREEKVTQQAKEMLEHLDSDSH